MSVSPLNRCSIIFASRDYVTVDFTFHFQVFQNYNLQEAFIGNMPFDQNSSFRFFLRMSPRIACHYYKVGGNQFPKLECKFLLRASLSFSRGCHVQKVLKRMSCPYLSYFHKDSYLSLSLIKTDSYLSFSYGVIP